MKFNYDPNLAQFPHHPSIYRAEDWGLVLDHIEACCEAGEPISRSELIDQFGSASVVNHAIWHCIERDKIFYAPDDYDTLLPLP